MTEPPPGPVITPSLDVSSATAEPSSMAAASSRAPLAIAAATRIGVKVETVVLEPPVSWLNTSSGRAGARVTCTFSTGRSSSSAMIIAVEVVMPWPTSIRGMAKDAVPSLLIVIVISCEVGPGRVGLQVLEVVGLGDLRRGRDDGGRRGRAEAQVGGDHERRGRHHVAEEASAAEPRAFGGGVQGRAGEGVTQLPLARLRPGRLPGLPPP